MSDRVALAPRSPVAPLLLAPILALGVGIAVMVGAEVGPVVWIQNLVAMILGVALALVAARRSDIWTHRAVRRWVVPVGVVTLLLTLVVPGIEGVHRWLPLGPVRMHAAALLLPAMLLAFSEMPLRPASIIAAIVGAILLIQPDFAQAAAFAAGWSALALTRWGWSSAPGIAAVTGSALLCLLRSDPLEPVSYVEDIGRLAFEQGAGLGYAAVMALVFIPLAWFVARSSAAAAVGIYLAVTVVVGWFANFPVPVLGFGASPILGYYLGVATFMMLERPGKSVAVALTMGGGSDASE